MPPGGRQLVNQSVWMNLVPVVGKPGFSGVLKRNDHGDEEMVVSSQGERGVWHTTSPTTIKWSPVPYEGK